MENDLTDEFTRARIYVEKQIQEAELRNAIEDKSMYKDTTNMKRKRSNAPTPPPRPHSTYSTGVNKTEVKYETLKQEKAYYGDANELKARNETGYWDTSDEECLYEEVGIPSLILKTTL